MTVRYSSHCVVNLKGPVEKISVYVELVSFDLQWLEMVFNFQQVESVFEKPDEKPEEEQSTFASKLFIPFVCCSVRTKIMTGYQERGDW